MSTAISIRFPLGRYHATPWERAVNEGEVEWPPSPWRIVRALISTWHLRWPELAAADFDDLLVRLTCSAPAYKTPAVSAAHTRHYMPDLAHMSGTPSTDLVLDPFVWIDPASPLTVRWDVDLDPAQRIILAKLCELVPYLGRSESLAQLELLESAPSMDDTWWTVGTDGRQHTQLLVPDSHVTRELLETTTSDVRRQRLNFPPATTLVSYAREVEAAPGIGTRDAPRIEAIRWRLVTKAPFLTQHGVLATEQLRMTRLRLAERAVIDLPVALSGKLQASTKATDDHGHAHWLWLSDDRAHVTDLVLWMPHGDLEAAAASSMVERSGLPGFANWNPQGFRPGSVHVVAMGTAASVMGELTGTSRLWTGTTPYLPVRHRKRGQTVEEWILADLSRECSYRKRAAPTDVIVLLDASQSPTVTDYRRYRWRENMGQRRTGFWVSMSYSDPATGPLCLGQLSHFGFGLFEPSKGVR